MKAEVRFSNMDYKEQKPQELQNKTWEMWTLSYEDIQEAADGLDLKNVDLDIVAQKFKKCLSLLIGDNWDECLRDCIKETACEGGV